MTSKQLHPLCLTLLFLAGCSTTRKLEPPTWPLHALAAEQTIALNLPGGKTFQASGLLLMPGGELLTISDTAPAIFRIRFLPDHQTADLIQLTNCFTQAALAPLAGQKHGRFDCEGLARDEQGRLYLCEESDRWILRCDPRNGRVDRLPIDWTPVEKFFSTDRNASFEGIAIGDGKLYIANERSSPVIIVVDLGTLKVVDHFVVEPRTPSLFGILHYSDLSWWDHRLYVLARQHRVVLELDPRTHRVLAEFNYRELEDRIGYTTQLPVGVMEGLAVDRDFFWLVTDNNGLGRGPGGKDTRPTLCKCRRRTETTDGHR